jgi:hypothetical protein
MAAAASRGNDPYGTLARTTGESNVGGVLARSAVDQSDMYGTLSALHSSSEGTGGSLTAAGVGGDDSWEETPEGRASGGVLFDKSLAGRDDADVALASRARAAHKVHRDEVMKSEAIGGSLASLGPSSQDETWGTLSAVKPGSDANGEGTLSLVKMSNPDGVLAIYGKTGEYVEKQQAAKADQARLNTLAKMESQAAALHAAQAKRLAALRKAEEAQKQRDLQMFIRYQKQQQAKKEAAAAEKSEEEKRRNAEASKAKAAIKHVTSTMHKAVTAGAFAGGVGPAIAATAFAGAGGKRGAKLAEDDSAADGDVEEEETPAEEKANIKRFNDVGWEKHEWNAPSWALFFFFGPVVTALAVFIVWYVAGVIPAVVMLVMLLCLDIGAYYYSWYLV